MVFKCWGCGWRGDSTLGGTCPNCGGTDHLTEEVFVREARCSCPPENFLHLDTCPEFFPGGLKKNANNRG